jgi:hypothetical protein
MDCGSSSITPLLVIVLTVPALAYSLGWYRFRNDLPISQWQLATFIIALTSLAGAWATPPVHLDHQSLIWHMVQHLVLMTIAAPLILRTYDFSLSSHAAVRRAFGVSCLLRPHCLSVIRVWPGSFDNLALRNQECAGAVMWVWITFAYLPPPSSSQSRDCQREHCYQFESLANETR